jgi:hypothetical protein
VIQDRRSFAGDNQNIDQISQLAIGIYDPTNGIRLPARNQDDQPLPNDAFILAPAQ